MEYKYTAIILSKQKIGETDRLYNFFTLERGKLRAQATGTRKVASKLAPALENFMLVDMIVAKSKGLGKITSAVIEDGFWYLRKNEQALQGCLEVLRRLEKILTPEEADVVNFRLTVEYLSLLDKLASQNKLDQTKTQWLTLSFLAKALENAGYLLEANSCALCGKTLTAQGLSFSSQQGGILCATCGQTQQQIVPVSANMVKSLRLIFSNKLESLCKVQLASRELVQLQRSLDQFLLWVA